MCVFDRGFLLSSCCCKLLFDFCFEFLAFRFVVLEIFQAKVHVVAGCK